MSKFVDNGVGLQWKTKQKTTGSKKSVTDDYSIQLRDGEWLVYHDPSGEVVGEWDSESDARDHAEAMQDSDDAVDE